MEQSGFDDLAKALSNGSGSRRRALQMVGAALVGAPLIAAFPVSAAGSGKKRCKKKHGIYLTSGECNCAVAWHKGTQAPEKFRCENTAGCACAETVSGDGSCASYFVRVNHEGCESDEECDTGTTCTVLSGASCNDTKPCTHPQFKCTNGTCQFSACRPPCS
jgi:hypothetical protein